MIEIFLHNIKWLRKHYGFTKKEWAKKLGIGLWSLNKIEKGELPSRLKIDVLFCIYKEFGIPMWEMVSVPLDELQSRPGLAGESAVAPTRGQ